MQTRFKLLTALGVVSAAIAVPLIAQAGPNKKPVGEFDEASFIYEVNETDEDAEVVLYTKAEEPLKKLTVRDPRGKKIVSLVEKDRAKLGLQQILLESGEPTAAGVQAAFPAGTYVIQGVTTTGGKVRAEIVLSHDVLPAPTFTPLEGAVVPADAVVISWDVVVGATGYALEVENDDLGMKLQLEVDASVTSFAVPAGLLLPDTTYQIGVASVSAIGNVSVAEIEFDTAP